MRSVNEELQPLNKLLMAYAKPADRSRYALVFAFDSKCGEVIRSTSEPLIGQMRLTWWRDILTKPLEERPAGEPLVELVNAVESQGSDVRLLAGMLEGWEIMLEDFPWDDRQFDRYSVGRGLNFFAFALDGPIDLGSQQALCAQSWALWDFARHCSDQAMRDVAFQKCREIHDQLGKPDFDRNGRPLSIFCNLVARDVKKGRLSGDLYRPSTAVRVIWHGLTGK